MKLKTPVNNRAYYAALLDDLLRRQFVKRVFLGGERAQSAQPRDPPVGIHECARFKIILSGAQRHDFSRGDQRCDVMMRPGDAVFWSPHAWTITHVDRRCRFLAVIFHRGHVRLLIGGHDGGANATFDTPNWLHTSTPLAGPGLALLPVMAAQSELPAAPAIERPLFNALLGFTREHLAAESDVSAASKALHTYQRISDHIDQNYATPISRETVAAALDLHPNYVSALCRQAGGKSFQDLLQDTRINRARRLLRHSDLSLDRVAQLCGYSATNYFIKVFRKASGMTPGRFRLSR